MISQLPGGPASLLAHVRTSRCQVVRSVFWRPQRVWPKCSPCFKFGAWWLQGGAGHSLKSTLQGCSNPRRQGKVFQTIQSHLSKPFGTRCSPLHLRPGRSYEGKAVCVIGDCAGSEAAEPSGSGAEEVFREGFKTQHRSAWWSPTSYERVIFSGIRAKATIEPKLYVYAQLGDNYTRQVKHRFSQQLSHSCHSGRKHPLHAYLPKKCCGIDQRTGACHQPFSCTSSRFCMLGQWNALLIVVVIVL